VRNFNQSVQVSKPAVVFQLGTLKPAAPVVTLRRLIGKDESEIRKMARDRLIDQARK